MHRQTLCFLPLPCPIHLPSPSYCDVDQLLSYFASNVCPFISLTTCNRIINNKVFITIPMLFFFRGSTVLQDPGRLTYRRFLGLFRHMVGLLGRVISPSQGLYLHRTTQTSVPWAGFEPTIPATNRPRPTPQTTRPLWPTYRCLPFWNQRRLIYTRHVVKKEWRCMLAQFGWWDLLENNL
jgi:hypothetical protein